MDLHILSQSRAIFHKPEKPTYAVRITMGAYPDDFDRLQKSEYWVRETRYVFDDIWPGMIGGSDDEREIMFDGVLAERMLIDFAEDIDKCESLMVHCARGENRSPAVGIAFNEIFDLGHDNEGLKKKYPDSNWHVYEMLVKVSKGLGMFTRSSQ